MASIDSPWDTAPEYFIDLLAAHLKRTRRWSRDARSLRALNGHWRAVLTRHVVQVNPHQSRKLGVEDIHSLSKFQNLTALDAVPFEGYGNEGKGKRCRVLAETLCQLPRLAKLHVKYLLEYVEDDNSQFLFSIDSIHYRDSLPSEQQILKLKASSIQKLVSPMTTRALIDFLHLRPSLKTLIVPQINDLTEHFEEIVKSTSRLEALSLPWGWFNGNVTKLQSLAALDIWGHSGGQGMEPLLDLPKLTSLRLYCPDEGVFQGTPLENVLKRLVSFDLKYSYDCPLIDAIVESTTLKEVILEGPRLRREAIEVLGSHPSLSVSLVDYSFSSDVRCSKELPALKDFRFREYIGHRNTVPKGLLSSMKYLEHLTLLLRRTAIDADLMTMIQNMKKLESLSISGVFENAEAHQFSFEAFDQLGELPYLSTLSVSGQASLEAIKEFMNTELCSSLSELSIYILTRIDIFFLQEYANTLRSKAPHLKLICQSV